MSDGECVCCLKEIAGFTRGPVLCRHCVQHQDWNTARDKQRIAQLEEGKRLREYARHKGRPTMCPKAWHEFDPRPSDICTCGLDDLLAGEEK